MLIKKTSLNVMFINLSTSNVFLFPGYGFVDFDNPSSAQRAVASLQGKGMQAQMAKVCCLMYSNLLQIVSCYTCD